MYANMVRSLPPSLSAWMKQALSKTNSFSLGAVGPVEKMDMGVTLMMTKKKEQMLMSVVKCSPAERAGISKCISMMYNHMYMHMNLYVYTRS